MDKYYQAILDSEIAATASLTTEDLDARIVSRQQQRAAGHRVFQPVPYLIELVREQHLDKIPERSIARNLGNGTIQWYGTTMKRNLPRAFVRAVLEHYGLDSSVDNRLTWTGGI